MAEDLRQSPCAVSRETIIRRCGGGTEHLPGRAIRKSQQQRRRVIAVRRCSASHHGPHVADTAKEIDHAVHQMHADRGHGAAGCLLGLRAPGIRGQVQPVQRGLLAADADHSAQRAIANGRPQPAHRGMKTPVEPHGENDASTRRCRNHALRIGNGQREGFFHEHRFARRGSAPHLIGVQAMRRGKHHRIDRGIAQHRIQIAGPAQRVVAAEIRNRCGGACVGHGETNRLAAAHRVDQVLAPPAQADNGRVDHADTSARNLSTKACINCVRSAAIAWPAWVRKPAATLNSLAPKWSSAKCRSSSGLCCAAGSAWS